MSTTMSDDGFTFADQNTQRYPAFAVRQTVTNGPVDATGQAAFGGATGGTTITMTGTLEVNAANGVTGRRGSKVNASWPGLVTNGQMYLYVDINLNGTLTEGVGTLLRTEQQGGTPSIVSGQHTFNVGEMKGYVGNGATAVADTYRVYVGECTVAGGVVTAIVWYALNGRYRSALGANLPGFSSVTAYSTNMGTDFVLSKPVYAAVNKTTEFSYAVGDIGFLSNSNTSASEPASISGRNTVTVNAGSGGSCGFGIVSKANGSGQSPLAANWQPFVFLTRGW